MSTANPVISHASGGKFTFSRVVAVATLLFLAASSWTGYLVSRNDSNKLAQELATKAAVERANELNAAEALGAKKALEIIDHDKTKSTIDLVQSKVIPALETLTSSMGTMSAVVSRHTDGLKRIEELLKLDRTPEPPAPAGHSPTQEKSPR